MADPVWKTIAVVGAGTMGSGIALAALRAGLEVHLYDISEEVLQRAHNYIDHHLSRKGQQDRLPCLHPTRDLKSLVVAQAVIEAAPERLDIKQALFRDLSALCAPETLLASNTSTLSITELAAASQHPQRVVGMHFFNPAPVLPLVEVVRGAQSSDRTVGDAVHLARTLGKTPVVVRDTPGFVVNRLARPYYGEALRLVSEQVASPRDIDWILEGAAGFRMGPFRLMDLIGNDVNFTVMQSMFEQTFGETRYLPSLLQQQKVQEGALGRKTGRGFYVYAEGREPQGPPEPQSKAGASFTIGWVAGSWIPEWRSGLEAHGHRVVQGELQTCDVVVIAAGWDEHLLERVAEIDARLPESVPVLCQTVDTALSEILAQARHRERWVGLDGLFLPEGRVATLVEHEALDSSVRGRVEQIFEALGKVPVWIRETPALVAPRIVAMLVNEASFAVLEGVAEEATIDLAMKLGVNYPHGPLEWARRLGYGRVLAILDHLYNEYREPRYRACVWLRRKARLS